MVSQKIYIICIKIAGPGFVRMPSMSHDLTNYFNFFLCVFDVGHDECIIMLQ